MSNTPARPVNRSAACRRPRQTVAATLAATDAKTAAATLAATDEKTVAATLAATDAKTAAATLAATDAEAAADDTPTTPVAVGGTFINPHSHLSDVTHDGTTTTATVPSLSVLKRR